MSTRQNILSFVITTIVLSLLCPAARGNVASERTWFVGYAETDITPAPGQTQMSGFGRERYAQGMQAPLLTQVVALRDRDGRMGVLITADILGFDRVMVEAIRRTISHKHHIPAENIMLAASHKTNVRCITTGSSGTATSNKPCALLTKPGSSITFTATSRSRRIKRKHLYSTLLCPGIATG